PEREMAVAEGQRVESLLRGERSGAKAQAALASLQAANDGCKKEKHGDQWARPTADFLFGQGRLEASGGADGNRNEEAGYGPRQKLVEGDRENPKRQSYEDVVFERRAKHQSDGRFRVVEELEAGAAEEAAVDDRRAN